MEKLNIFQKLVEVRKTVEYLKKDTEGYQFKFVSSSQTLGSLRKAMDEYNLLLVPSIFETEIRDHQTSKGSHEYFTAIKIKFTWINADQPEEKIECDWIGQGLDSGEKGVGKACTYAEKYFLLKFFNIATDKDDPDKFQDKTNNDSPQPKKDVDQKQKTTKEEVIKKIIANVRKIADDELPENATDKERGIMLTKVMEEVSFYEFEGKNKETGETEIVTLKISHPDKLTNQKDGRLGAIYKNTKDRLEKENPSDEQKGLQF